jgi:hypothetical protein
VISHEIETEDEKRKILKKMKESKDTEQNPLDMSKYGTNSGTVEKPENVAVVEFEYREIIGKDQEWKKASEGNGGDKGKEGFIAKYIAPYGYAGI